MDNENALTRSMRASLEKRRQDSTLRRLTISPNTSVDFSSNDFLSLSTSPELRQTFLEELAKNGDFPMGSGGSRLLDGNSLYAESLEREIAAFHNAPTGLLFNSGFDANVSLYSTLPQPGDVVLYDELIHASVHEGMRLSRAGKTLPFLHNSVLALKRMVAAQVETDPLVREGRRNIFVAVESVYSMDGDVAPLLEIVEAVDKLLPYGNGHIIVDEAHSTGLFGPMGRGLVCELGLEERIFARLHTFGKALACGGAITLCSAQTRDYLVNYARPMIYTTFMPFPSLAAIKSSYQFLQSGKAEPLRLHLKEISARLHASLGALIPPSVSPSSHLLHLLHRITPDTPRSCIFSIWTPFPRSLAKYCQDGGFVVRAIVAPTVPVGTERVRICLHAANTVVEVDALVSRIKEWILLREKDISQQKLQSRL